MASEKKIAILQIGSENWCDLVEMPENIHWVHLLPSEIESFMLARKEQDVANKKKIENDEKPTPLIKFQGLFLTDTTYNESLMLVFDLVKAHEVFYPKQLTPIGNVLERFLHLKLAQYVDINDKSRLLYVFSKALFSGQYGDKFAVNSFNIIESNAYQVNYEGGRYVAIFGEYGDDYTVLGTYAFNKTYTKNMFINLWQEKIIAETVSLKIVVQLILSGSVADVVQEWVFEGEDLSKQIEIDAAVDGFLSISVFAKGYGQIKLGPLHYRHGRHGLGEFLIGGERFVDEFGQEINFYFNPQDYKPPLNVYFSGFRTAEGFEGYWMMQSLGAPYILICDPRNTGGAFYLGSESLEKSIVMYIQKKLDFLGFTNKQLNLSGLSMGTYGALYYGADFNPNAIVISKPLVNLGTVAANERLNRPEGFPTSLDLLHWVDNRLSIEGVHKMNRIFWDKFNYAQLNNIKIIVAYMKDDDYENDVYPQLLHVTKDKEVTIVSKGLSGRHGDKSDEATGWFYMQYKKMLEKDFGRGLE